MCLPVEQLHSRAGCPAARVGQGGGKSYIEEAVDREAPHLCPPGYPKRSSSSTHPIIDPRGRYNKFGATGDLEWAIVLFREALDLCPQGHPGRPLSLNNLAVGFFTRYQHLGTIDDLDEAIILDREALNLRPQGHRDRSVSLNILAIHLSSRYKHLGTIEDLDEAIVLGREALDLRPHGHRDRSMSLNNLAVDLSARYKQLSGIEDLNEAIVLGREALDLCPQGHPDRSMSLNNFGGVLFARYKQLGAANDLNEAISLGRQALELRPEGHPDRPVSLSHFAAVLFAQYKQLGGVEDPNEAIVLCREALDLYSQGHPDRLVSLIHLGGILFARYKQLGAMDDLNEAIILGREALGLCPQGHPDRSVSLIDLAAVLCTRYNQLGGREDLDAAIVLGREVLDLRPQGHLDRSMSLNHLAAALSTRYKQLLGMEDLEEAIIIGREALDLCPQGHPDRSMSLNNLAFHLSTRYQQLGEIEDLDVAIVLDREALDLRLQGHPDRSAPLSALACHLCDRFIHFRQSHDKEEVFSLYTQLVHVPQIVSSADVSAAVTWTRMAQIFQHPTILLAYETSLRLLTQHLATLPSLPRHLASLTSSLAVDAFSACLHERAPVHAVELLEQGRGVLWSQLTCLRSPLDDLMISGPAGKMLTDEFTRLALLIRKALDSPSPYQHERVSQLNLDMERVATNVRELPGLSRFLLPSLFPDLQLAASGGPVIIVNASKYSCDALIVLLGRDPVHIALQISQEGVRGLSTEFHTLTVRARKVDVTRELMTFSRKLWARIVSPVVGFLRTTHPFQSRIWWCPTAEFSALPLHAAGPYREGQQNLADIYISSYTPTLTALIRARRRDPASQRKRFIAIGQAEAVGKSKLVSVGAELDSIGRVVDGLATFTRIDGEEACISRVVEELGKNDWVHLACHGFPNLKKPFESAFALRDGHLTIQQIIVCGLKNPEFAYLCGCHTTVGDEESPDEVIHLASAMHFAGFHSVVGTVWDVDDGETNKITSTFYKYMVDESGRLDHTRAALALNKTMKTVDVPFDQGFFYIHVGA